MRSATVAILGLLAAVALFNLGLGLQGTLLGVRASLEGFALPAIGLIMSGNYVGFVLGALLTASLVGRVGHIRAFAALAAVTGCAVMLHALFVAPLPWFLFRAATGFGYCGLCLIIESWLNHRTGNAERGGLLALYMAVTLGSSAAGNLFLNTWPAEGFQLFVLVGIAISLSLVPVALTTSPAPPFAASRRMQIVELWRASPAGVVGCLATGVLYSAFGGMGAVFAERIGLSTLQISLFMALVVAGGIAAIWPLGRLSDRFDRRWVMAVLFLCAAAVGLAILLAVLLGAEPTALLILDVLYGAATLPIYGIAAAHANDRLTPEQYVPAAGTLLLCYGLGAVCGPFGGSLAMTALGPVGLFAYLALGGGVSAAFILWRLMRRA